MKFREYLKEATDKSKLKLFKKTDFDKIAKRLEYDNYKDMVDELDIKVKADFAFKLLDGNDDMWAFVDKAFINSKGKSGKWFATNEFGEELDSVLQIDQMRQGKWKDENWPI